MAGAVATFTDTQVSKRYKGKTCAYCAAPNASDTGDHVFAREFFPADRRENLPKVPACSACNNRKAALEHYLTAVLPFGGLHPDAGRVLREMVPARLANNAKLHQALTSGQALVLDGSSDTVAALTTLPFESEKLSALFEFVARGLAVHHWGAAVPRDYNVAASMLTAVGEAHFAKLLELNGARVVGSVGEGAFRYEGLQSPSDPGLTIWKFEVFGGIGMRGDPRAPDESAPHIWVITSRSSAVSALLEAEPTFTASWPAETT